MLENVVYCGRVAPLAEVDVGAISAFVVTAEANGYALWLVMKSAEPGVAEDFGFFHYYHGEERNDAFEMAVKRLDRERVKWATQNAPEPEPAPVPDEGPLTPEVTDAQAVQIGTRILEHEGGPVDETAIVVSVCPNCNRRIGGHYSWCKTLKVGMGKIGSASI